MWGYRGGGSEGKGKDGGRVWGEERDMGSDLGGIGSRGVMCRYGVLFLCGGRNGRLI